jgi:hypothetical protein
VLDRVAVGGAQALQLNREAGRGAVLVGPHTPRGGVGFAKEQQPRAVDGSAHGGCSGKLVMP